MTEEWLHQTVDVDLTSVGEFAARMQKSVLEFGTSLDDGVKPLMADVHPRFGGLVVAEGAFFGAMHAKHVTAAMNMLNDVTKGLTALTAASYAVHAEYLLGDAEGQATVDDVYDAFVPTPQPAGSPDATTTGTGPVEEDPELPPEAYQGGVTSSPPSGSGHYVAEGKPGQYWVSGDNESMDVGTPDAPQPRA